MNKERFTAHLKTVSLFNILNFNVSLSMQYWFQIAYNYVIVVDILYPLNHAGVPMVPRH